MCPSFLPLPRSREGGPPSGKHLQLFISHNMGCQYYVGRYDTERQVFLPEGHGRMSWVDNTFFAPEALIDGNGRQIMWGMADRLPGAGSTTRRCGTAGAECTVCRGCCGWGTMTARCTWPLRRNWNGCAIIPGSSTT